MSEEEAITIVIDGIPVAKGRGKVGKLADGRAVVFTPTKTRTYETLLRERAGYVMDGRDPLDVPLKVMVTAFLPVPISKSKKWKAAALAGEINPTTKPDTDNYLKAALDGLNTIVFRDDSLVTDLLGRKRYSEKPRLEIVVIPCMPVLATSPRRAPQPCLL